MFFFAESRWDAYNIPTTLHLTWSAATEAPCPRSALLNLWAIPTNLRTEVASMKTTFAVNRRQATLSSICPFPSRLCTSF